MCLQCTTEAVIVYREILPEWVLMRATKDTDKWKAGEYGLVYMNDPDFIWSGEPIEDQTADMTDDEINVLTDDDSRWISSNNHFDFVDSIEGKFVCDPMKGYRLIRACMAAGYDPHDHGYRVVSWLVNHIAKKLKESRHE